MRIKAVILAGGEGTRLATLTHKRAKPAVPFAGKYRIIDFTLSNCVNSQIFDVLILTQYRPHSLNDHIRRGRPWDLDRSFTGGVLMLQPFLGRRDTDWYAGTADAVAQNLPFVRRGRPEYVLILSGDHIYQMDYAEMLQFHRENNADATVATIRVPMDEASRYGIVDVETDFSVRDFVEKPPDPPGNLASMGVYLFNYDVLERMLHHDHELGDSSHDFGKDILPRMLIEKLRVFAWPFGGYWIDVGTIDAYWEAHMDLLGTPPSLNLSDRTWIIHTRSEERPPVQIQHGAIVRDSLISEGAVIAGGALVERSVLSPGVIVGPNAIVRESILLNDTCVEAGAVIERAIIDKIAIVGHNARVGCLGQVGDLGITCVGKNTHIPAGFTIGSSCIIGTDLQPGDFNAFPDRQILAGEQLGFQLARK